ncbi:uncharacterized protein [Rutidosis leptorrhynchoides]|uniref:uncharacterized protein n=1 Tax=Rutidosis leptorrhynchoides TaxID=125765 RepID=UPI003A9968B2
MNINPRVGEAYFLRLLLTVCKGATSFKDLMLLMDNLCDNFGVACKAHALVGDDTEWLRVMEDVHEWASSSHLRYLFAVILMFCDVSNCALICNFLSTHLFSCNNEWVLGGCQLTEMWLACRIFDQKSCISHGLAADFDSFSGLPKTDYSSWPAGHITIHSAFAIPINAHQSSTCRVKKNTHRAELLRRADLVSWDEAPMTHRFCFEAVNRTLNDICIGVDADDVFFGGDTFVLDGDFRQTLPVVEEGDEVATISASITKSDLWPHFKVLKLISNMRLA